MQQLITLHEMIKLVFIFNLMYDLLYLIIIFTVYLVGEAFNKTTTIQAFKHGSTIRRSLYLDITAYK